MTDPAAQPLGRSWPIAASTAGIGIVLMVLVGGVLAPFGRLILGGLYGVVERTILHPFGIAIPGVVTLVLVNLAILATSLAAGRRVGAIIAHRLVEGQLGSPRLLSVIPWAAGAAGAAAYAASVPWMGVAGGGTLRLASATNLTFGYLLHLVVLLIGPARGAARYLFTHPYCPRCWVWLQRETGGGSFRQSDVPRLTAALAAQDLESLKDLPLANPSLPGATCSLQWLACPACRERAFVTCSRGESADGAALYSTRLDGPSVEALRALIAHRRALAHPDAPRPPPSAAARLS